MSNNEKLFKYLVGNKENNEKDDLSYLLGKSSIHKVTMISGVWGSGKTYFWNDIRDNKLKEKYKNIYISLYGKDSIESIQNELFLKAYNIGLGRSNDEKDLIEKTYSLMSGFTKDASKFVGLDLSVLDDKNNKTKLTKAKKALDNELIICFDDFERKSSKIDLNDLFGFISNLSIEFKCKIVIILNSDAFEDDDKKIFTRVREKTVHKYFLYSPSYEYLFNEILSSSSYELDTTIEQETLELITMTKLLNARVYEQVISNVCEYHTYLSKKEIELDFKLLRILVLNTIYFNLYHSLLKVTYTREDTFSIIHRTKIEFLKQEIILNYNHIAKDILIKIPYRAKYDNIDIFRKSLFENFLSSEQGDADKNKAHREFILKHNELYFISLYIYEYKIYDFNYPNYYEKIEKIWNFIETGILIDE